MSEVPRIGAGAARIAGRAQSFGLQHGIPAAYGSYEKLLAAPDVDAVYVPLPNSRRSRRPRRAR